MNIPIIRTKLQSFFFAAALSVGCASTSQAVTAPLTWAPPTGWENYTTITIPASGGTVTMNDSTNYRVLAPNKIIGSVILKGGKNVVWIGGHIQINVGENGRGPFDSAPTRRAVRINDGTSATDGRIVFLEGIRMDGNDMSEGINTGCPKAHVYLQNIGIDTLRHHGFDDRDGTGDYAPLSSGTKNHCDLIQLFGGYKSLRIDGFSGKTQYQGFFFSSETVNTGKGDIYMRRVNASAVEFLDENQSEEPFLSGLKHAGHRGMTWYGDQVNHIFIDNGTFWYKHHVNSGHGPCAPGSFLRGAFRDSNNIVNPESICGNSGFVNNFAAGAVYPPTSTSGAYQPQTGSDATGAYVFWSDSATAIGSGRGVSDWANTAAGRIYSGTPPGGDYVPVLSVGIAYTSPGYGGGGTGDMTAPTAPTNLNATASGPGEVDLTWTASTDNVGVTSYSIERGGAVVGSSTTTSFTDITVQASTTYTYVVKAKDAAGNTSGPSNSDTVTTPADMTQPTAPTGLTAAAASSSQINLSWTASTDDVGVVKYRVERGGTLVGEPTGTSFSNTGLSPSTTYSYIVKAQDAAGNTSGPSNTATATTLASGTVTTVTLNPVADSYVRSASPTNNYGNNSNLRVINNGTNVRVIYMKFDLSSLAGQTITSAKLRLFAQDTVSGQYSVKTVSSTSWSESTINWNNRPVVGTTVLGTISGATTGTWKEIDLSVSPLQAAAGQLFSLAIDTAATVELRFESKEGSPIPQLVLTKQ